MDTEKENQTNKKSEDQPNDIIEIVAQENIKVSEDRKRSSFKKIELTAVLLSTIVGIATSIISGVSLRSEGNRITIPYEYLSIIITILSILVGTLTMSFSIFQVYKKQQKQRSLTITLIREKEKTLFADLDKRISAVVK